LQREACGRDALFMSAEREEFASVRGLHRLGESSWTKKWALQESCGHLLPSADCAKRGAVQRIAREQPKWIWSFCENEFEETR